MSSHRFSQSQLDQFNQDGYLIARGLFAREEIDLVQQIAIADAERRKTSWAATDTAGRSSKLWLDVAVKNDVYGAIVRSPRIVEPIRQILGGPLYTWHYKMMQKEPRVGGAWEWHQDYGYWYHDGCIAPDLVSCMVGVNRANRANGCLQVIRGSNRIGRIDHGRVAGQVGADAPRVEAILSRRELVYGELEPGDALFFHCNTLHCSGPNESEQPRWSFITCYNAMSNIPVSGKGHGEPVELQTALDDALLQAARAHLEKLQTTGATAN